MRSTGDREERVTVRRRFGDDVSGDLPARARAVVNDELLSLRLRKLGCEYARCDIGRSAGRKADEHTHRPVGVIADATRGLRVRG